MHLHKFISIVYLRFTFDYPFIYLNIRCESIYLFKFITQFCSIAALSSCFSNRSARRNAFDFLPVLLSISCFSVFKANFHIVPGQYPYRPQSKRPVPALSSVKKPSTGIVLSQKDQYPHRPRTKSPVPVSSSVKKASTRIVLGQKGQYRYRPRSKRPVPVSSSDKKASTGIVLGQKGQYRYRHTNTDTGVTDVPVMAFCQYGHGRIKDSTRIVLSRKGQYPH